MEEEVDEVERKSEERREKREREREIEGEKRRSGFGGERDVRVPSPQKIRWNLLLVVGQNRIKAV